MISFGSFFFFPPEPDCPGPVEFCPGFSSAGAPGFELIKAFSGDRCLGQCSFSIKVVTSLSCCQRNNGTVLLKWIAQVSSVLYFIRVSVNLLESRLNDSYVQIFYAAKWQGKKSDVGFRNCISSAILAHSHPKLHTLFCGENGARGPFSWCDMS